MPLKPVVSSLDEVPEPFRPEYEARDGRFVLKLDGDPPDVIEVKRKLAEFRDNNRVKETELTSLRAQLEPLKDIDPEEYKSLKAKIAALETKGVKGADDVQLAIQQALAEHEEKKLKPILKQLEQEKTANAQKQEKLNRAKLREVVGAQLGKARALPEAMDYLFTQAEQVFIVEDGEVKAKPDKYSEAKPTELLGIDEWVATTAKKQSFAFEQSKGGGATGSNGAARSGGKVIVNPTPQELGAMAREKENPFEKGIRIVNQ